jgi:hypothetical protein
MQPPSSREEESRSRAQRTAANRPEEEQAYSSSPLAAKADERGRETCLATDPVATTRDNQSKTKIAPSPLLAATAGRRMLNGNHQLGRPDQLRQIIRGSAASAIPGQLRPEEHADDDEEPYSPDLKGYKMHRRYIYLFFQ